MGFGLGGWLGTLHGLQRRAGHGREGTDVTLCWRQQVRWVREGPTATSVGSYPHGSPGRQAGMSVPTHRTQVDGGPPNTVPEPGQKGNAQLLGLQEQSPAAGSASPVWNRAGEVGTAAGSRSTSHCQSEPRQKAVRGKPSRSAQWASLPCWQAPGPHKSPATIGYYSFSLFLKQDNALGARVAENRKARSPGAPELSTLVLISHKHTHLLCLGVGVSVLQGGNREASVPSGSDLASRMSACSVARFSVPGDATQWNVS